MVSWFEFYINIVEPYLSLDRVYVESGAYILSYGDDILGWCLGLVVVSPILFSCYLVGRGIHSSFARCDQGFIHATKEDNEMKLKIGRAS